MRMIEVGLILCNYCGQKLDLEEELRGFCSTYCEGQYKNQVEEQVAIESFEASMDRLSDGLWKKYREEGRFRTARFIDGEFNYLGVKNKERLFEWKFDKEGVDVSLRYDHTWQKVKRACGGWLAFKRDGNLETHKIRAFLPQWVFWHWRTSPYLGPLTFNVWGTGVSASILYVLSSPPPEMYFNNYYDPGFVYVINIPFKNKRGKAGAIYCKIGKSKDPFKRLAALQVSSPFPLEMMAVIETGKMTQLEKNLHYRFQNNLVRGEWYLLKKWDREYLKTL